MQKGIIYDKQKEMALSKENLERASELCLYQGKMGDYLIYALPITPETFI